MRIVLGMLCLLSLCGCGQGGSGQTAEDKKVQDVMKQGLRPPSRGGAGQAKAHAAGSPQPGGAVKG